MDKETDELLKQANELFNNKKYDEVIILLSDEILNKHINAALFALRGWAHDRLEQTEESFLYSNKAIETDPTFGKGYRIRGRALRKRKEYDKSITDFNKAIELDPKDSFSYFNRGNSFTDTKEYDKAIADFSYAIELNPDQASSYYNRGNCYYDIGEYDKAILDFNRALEMHPRDDAFYYNRGNTYSKKGDRDKAIADYSKAIEINPKDASSYNNRGNNFNAKGEYDKAIADYDKAIELKGNSPEYYVNRGNAYYKKGDNGEALNNYNKAIEINPGYFKAFHNRGTVYKNIANFASATKDFRKSIELSPDNPVPHKSLGDLLFEMKQYDEAIAEYEIAVNLDPNNNLYKNLRDNAKAKQGEAVTTYAENRKGQIVTTTASYVEQLISEFDENIKVPIRIACADTDKIIEGIRELLLYKKNDSVVHYTRIKTADLVAMNKNLKLRYTNVVFMNDPEEGSIFINHLLYPELKDSFKRADRKDDNNIYLGSFLPESKRDYLIMWRTYGKNEHNEEATGCSFLIKRDFFDRDGGFLFLQEGEVDSLEEEMDYMHSQPLYRVIYYDKELNHLIMDNNEDLPKLNKALEDFKQKLRQLVELRIANDKDNRIPLNKTLDKLIYRFISELRYFFKSAEYQFEKELRVIKYYPIDDPKVITDKETTEIPRRLYIESTKELQPYLQVVTLGPKVVHPERYMYIESQLRKNENDVSVKRSECSYQ